ncbi:MAG: hypothetical protein WKF55_01820 [Gemmatimonadaceae bacterium]
MPLRKQDVADLQSRCLEQAATLGFPNESCHNVVIAGVLKGTVVVMFANAVPKALTPLV